MEKKKYKSLWWGGHCQLLLVHSGTFLTWIAAWHTADNTAARTSGSASRAQEQPSRGAEYAFSWEKHWWWRTKLHWASLNQELLMYLFDESWVDNLHSKKQALQANQELSKKLHRALQWWSGETPNQCWKTSVQMWSMFFTPFISCA